MISFVLPPGYTARPPTREDAQAITDLIIAHDIAEHGAPDFDLESLIGDWERVGFVLERDAVIVLNESGERVGYANVWERDPGVLLHADGYVLPTYYGRGLEQPLIDWMEARARQALTNQPLRLIHYVSHSSQHLRQIFESAGFQPVRYALRMLIKMEAPPPAPEWPSGIEPRPFRPGLDDRAAHAVITEAFSDLDDFSPTSFEMWSQLTPERPDFRPAFSTVAWAGNELAGVAMCMHWPDMGWVRTLAVRRAWRKQGLGLALLRRSFGLFYEQGERTVGLGVDANNATGALRLYQSAGMHVARQYDQYQKVLLP
jgi:mycothiol synthase